VFFDLFQRFFEENQDGLWVAIRRFSGITKASASVPDGARTVRVRRETIGPPLEGNLIQT
jgi:hypothetical protein